MQTVCNQLIKTFDTNILKNQNKIIQSAFYLESMNNKDKPTDNTIFRLIRNHYKNKKPIVDYIGGPYVIRQLRHEFLNINIYLFGEMHSSHIDCPSVDKKIEYVENYFTELVKNTDVFLDIYFEFPVVDKNRFYNINIMAPQRMQELFLRFYKCIQNLTRENDDCKLSRIHYIDIRTSLDNLSNVNEISWLIYNFMLNKDNIKNIETFINTNIDRIKTIFTILASSSKEEYLNYFKNQLVHNKYVNKEINKSFFKDPIYQYIISNIEDEAIKYRDMIKGCIFNIQRFIDRYNNINKLNELLISINSPVVDGYTLARIFKKFNTTNILSQPSIPHNIIHYAGSNHTLRIYNFLLMSGFKEISRSGNIIDLSDRWENNIPNRYFNCVDMKEIKQPLFEN